MTKKWTKKEIDGLKEGVIPPNRSANSIKIMRNKLGLVKFKKPIWTDENKLKLRELLAEGKSTREISEILPYTQRSVQKEIVRQKLPHQNVVKFTEMEKIYFKKFLTEDFAQKTTKEIVDLWNQTNKRKVNERKVVVYLKKLNLKVSKAQVIRMTWLKKREEEWLKNQDLNSIRKRRVEIMAERYAKKLDLWKGLPLTDEDLESIDLEDLEPVPQEA